MELQPVRAIDLDRGLFEGLAIPFDGPLEGKDLYHTRFGKYTNFYFDWFPAGRPLLYQHGQDGDLRATPVGRQTRHTETDKGVWAEMQLNLAHDYAEQIKGLLKDEALYLSSGTMRHLIEQEGSMIRVWPWVELSLTPTPANPYAIADTGPTRSYFRSVGLHLPDSVEQRGMYMSAGKYGKDKNFSISFDGDALPLTPEMQQKFFNAVLSQLGIDENGQRAVPETSEPDPIGEYQLAYYKLQSEEA